MISVVVPAYDEEKNILPVFNELRKVMDSLGEEYEIIFVDDGSTDNTRAEMEKLPDVKVAYFDNNVGKSAALALGFSRAEGEIVVTMDSDAQDDPYEIRRLLEKMNEGFDLVVGWRNQRKHGIGKKIVSRFYNWLVRTIFRLQVRDMNCCLRIFRKEAIKGKILSEGMHRFLPLIFHLNGKKVGEIKVNHRPRLHGHSKYGAGRLAEGFICFLKVIKWRSKRQ